MMDSLMESKVGGALRDAPISFEIGVADLPSNWWG